MLSLLCLLSPKSFVCIFCNYCGKAPHVDPSTPLKCTGNSRELAGETGDELIGMGVAVVFAAVDAAAAARRPLKLKALTAKMAYLQ